MRRGNGLDIPDRLAGRDTAAMGRALDDFAFRGNAIVTDVDSIAPLPAGQG